MTDTPKRVVIWVAVSSEIQAGEKKESVGDQLRRQRERAAHNGWLIVDEIIVDGFSRDYLTYDEFSRAAAAEGFLDPMRMWRLWADHSFDILSCRDLDRIGREQSIVAEFVSRTMKAGAVIMPLDSAEVDMQNYRFASAIQGMGAAEHIDKMKRGRDLGMKGRAARGEKLSWRIPQFYVLTADGKVIPDRETYQRLFDDIYELFTAGTSYEQFPQALAARGHVHPQLHKPYHTTMLKRLLMTARTWGHGEFNRSGLKRGTNTLRAEIFCTGRGIPPADVYFVRDVCESIWLDEQHEAMIDELERRFYAIRGGARPNSTYAFSQLCVCAECGHNMAVQTHTNNGITYEYVKCPNAHKRLGCHNNLSVRFDKLEAFTAAHIDFLMSSENGVTYDTPPARTSRLPAVEKDIARLTNRISNWHDILGDAPIASRAELQAKIKHATDEREALYVERARLETAAREEAHTAKSRVLVLDSIRDTGLTVFWSQPPTTINQTLRKVLGNRRLSCHGGEVTGLA